MNATSVARQLIDDLRHVEAIAALERLEPGPLVAEEADLIRSHALCGLERYRQAWTMVSALLERKDLAPRQRIEARVLEARVLRRAGRSVDNALDTALTAARAAEREGGDALRLALEARLEAAPLFARKRCKALAERELARAREIDPNDPRILSADGYLHVEFDARTEANTRFRALLGKGERGERLGRLGLAWVALLCGEFAAAHAHLDAIGPLKSGDLPTRRMRARLFTVEQKWPEAARALAAVLEASPQADRARSDAYERALALYRAGTPADALKAFDDFLKTSPDEREWHTRQARRTTRLLSRPESASLGRRRLTEFPSVAQLRDHCGPASCELYLRYFGVPGEQVEIARAIKFPDGGTPVYRMRRFLEEAGFVARRVEADLERIKRLIDAGVPVIMEEDYSDSRHVAVAIGYDDRREVLEVQDPMTHEVRETYYEDLPKIRELSNHGALVAVPKSDAQKIAALDKIGAVECRYMSLVDRAWAAWHDKKTEEGDKLVDEAIGIREDYELAWFYRFRRARTRADEQPSPENKLALHRILAEVQRLWPDDEWPQQFAGEVLYVDGRYHEALQAYQQAAVRDDADAGNWSMIADCFLSLGKNDAAWDPLHKALERNPAHVRANENLAWLADRRGQVDLAWLLNDAARELHPENPFNHSVQGRLLLRREDWSAALAAFERALATDPRRRGDLIEKAKTLGKLGRVDDASATLRKEIEAEPKDLGLWIELSDLLYNHGRAKEAVAAAQKILELDPKNASGFALLGAAQAAAGELDTGIATMRRALAARPTYTWVYTQMGKHLLGTKGREMQAIETFAAALGFSGGRANCEYDLGDALVKAGFADAGVNYLWSAGSNGTLTEAELNRVGGLLVETRGDWNGFFNDVMKKRVDDLAVLRAHARTGLELVWAPGMMKPVLERIHRIAPEDPYARTWRGAGLMDESLGGEDEGEKLLRQAIAQAPELEYPRRVLAERLNGRGRFAEALEVLQPGSHRFTTVSLRVQAQLGIDDFAAADAAIAKFERDWPSGPDRPNVGGLQLRYKVARRRSDWKAALQMAEVLSKASYEREDDGRLDHWEEEKFECLVHLGETERALRFGEAQAVEADDLGRLAYNAVAADDLRLTEIFAERALRLDPQEILAVHSAARLAEIRGRIDDAIAGWERVGKIDETWHIWKENLARVHLGTGDVKRALQLAESAAAVQGHTCAWAFGVLGQARLANGNRAGATAALERCWKLAKPEAREHEGHDVWAIRALLAGDKATADRLLAHYLRADAPISQADRARVARLIETI
jgi:tetratricopeptide (TPR) repeat protein